MKVAVVGATGLVGTVMLKVLEERNFPVRELIPVASERSVGKEIEFKGKKFKVHSMQQAIAANPPSLYSQQEEVLLWSGHQNLQKQEQPLLIILQPGGWTPQKN